MSQLKNASRYPYFLGPDEHFLSAYYRRLSRLSLILMVLIFLMNEIFVRPKLAIYKSTPDALWSILALLLNAQVPLDRGLLVIAFMSIYILSLAICVCLLPKWGLLPKNIGLKSWLPPKDKYEEVYFLVASPLKKYAFTFWNLVLVPSSYIFASFLPCMFINLLRSLSKVAPI